MFFACRFFILLLLTRFFFPHQETEGELKEHEADPSRLEEGKAESLGKRQTRLEIAQAILQRFIPAIVVQTFILTFLAEWGDRSQITTIAMATAQVILPSLVLFRVKLTF